MTSQSKVSQDARRSLLSVSAVLAGVPLCVSGLLAGAALSTSLPLAEGLEAAFIGGLIVTLYAGLIGAIGARTGLTTTLLLRDPFGRIGASIVGVVLAVCLGGWYAVQTGYFGLTIYELFPNAGILSSPKVAVLWGGLLMMSTAYFGFRGLTYLSLLAVPLIVALSVWGVLLATAKVDVWSIRPEQVGTLGQAITLVVGSFAVGATVNADITRYSKSAMHAWLATAAGFFVANVYILAAGAATAMATGSGDLIRAMMLLGLGAPALIVLILGQWTTNDNNLYWASVNLAGAFTKAKKTHLVLACGTLATLSGVAGIADYFVPFLIWLGILIPPIGGIMVAHYFFIARNGPRNDAQTAVSFPAFIAWIGGSILGAKVTVGIPAINSIMAGLLIYLAIMFLFGRRTAPSAAQQPSQ